MLFWLIAAALTALACAAVLVPLARRPRALADVGNDLRVYRDQLAEVDRDLERGAIGAEDAEQARAEIGRRIMRVAGQGDARQPVASSTGFRIASLAAVLAVPLVSWGLYGAIGSPDMPSQPLQARLEKPPSESSPAELVARAESHLAQHPDDARGWEVLAPTYARLGRFSDAVGAYRNIIRLEGETADRLAGLAEAAAMANGGIVSEEAERGFKRALELQPRMPMAAFYLALGLMQDGRKAEAATAWREMLKDPNLEPAYRRYVENALTEVGAPTADAAQPGPSQEQVAAAAEMTDQDRAEMIGRMVAGLDEKLRANPNDPDGWIRLVRSYLMLRKPDEAKAAVKRALAALGGDSEAGKKVAAFAVGQGVSLTE